MWMTRPPAASMRAAAAITSITMNGGTSLRAEGVISRFAAFQHRSSLGDDGRTPCPAVAVFGGFRATAVGSEALRGINLPGSVQWARHRLQMRRAH